MYSNLVKRMDSNGYLFEATSIESAFDELEQQYGKTEYDQNKYSNEEMYWIGYIYRYWAYTYEKRSKQIYKYIKPEKLRDLYYPYHSLDPSQAIERIIEAEGIYEEDPIARGLRIMKRIRKNMKIEKI